MDIIVIMKVNPIKQIVAMPEYLTLSEEMRGLLKLLEIKYDKASEQRKAYAKTAKGKHNLKKASQAYETKQVVKRMANKGFIKAPVEVCPFCGFSGCNCGSGY